MRLTFATPILAPLLPLLLLACGDDDATRVCDPGRVVTCPCLGGGDGVQTCDVSGSAYGPCVCDGGTAPDATMDGGSRDAGRAEDARTTDSPSTPDGGAGCGDLDRPGTWSSLGSFSGPFGAESPSIALDADDTPFVAFEGGSESYVTTHGADGWMLIRHLNFEPGVGSRSPSLAIESSGRPLAAWIEPDPDYFAERLGVAHFDADTSMLLGAPISLHPGETSVWPPDVAVDPSGEIYVAFSEPEAVAVLPMVHVLHWDGSAWSPVGTARGPGNNPTLAFAPDGTPYVAWIEPHASGPIIVHVVVERWTGTDWEPVGPPLSRSPTVPPERFAFAVSNAGAPHVLLDGFVGSAAYLEVLRWTGVEWESLGSPDRDLAGSAGGIVGDIAFDARDRPLVTFTAGLVDGAMIVLRRYGSDTWSTLGGPIATVTTPPQYIGLPRLDVTSCGDPVVAWEQEDGPLSAEAIHVAKYTR